MGVDSKGVRTWRVEYNSASDQINLYDTFTKDSRSYILNWASRRVSDILLGGQLTLGLSSVLRLMRVKYHSFHDLIWRKESEGLGRWEC